MQHFFVNTKFIEHNRHFLSTYFLLDLFVLPYCFYRIRRELIYVLSIVVCIPSTFYPYLGHHQGRIYYKSDVTFVFEYYYYVRTSLPLKSIDVITECNLSLHEITSVFQSAVIFMSCMIMDFKICIFWQHLIVNTNFIEHNRHFLSTHFLLDPFVLPYQYSSMVKTLLHSCNMQKQKLHHFCNRSSPDDSPMSDRKY